MYFKADEAFTEVPSEYIDFADIFSPKLAVILPEHTGINNYAIKLDDDWQLPYNFIYNLRLMDLKIMKIYIKNNLLNGFIRPSQSLVWALIFFDKKSNNSLWLYIDYQGLNNLIIKNQYS